MSLSRSYMNFVLIVATRRRRNSVMRILRERGLSRVQAMLFGFKIRARQNGFFVAAINLCGVFLQDFVHAVLYWTLRLAVITPLFIFSRMTRSLARMFQSKPPNADDRA